jgi:hypothetical protein
VIHRLVRELQPGHVIAVGYDPDEKRLHWQRFGTPPPHLQIVAVTVERNVEVVDSDQDNAHLPPHVFVVPNPPHQLSILHEGQRWKVRRRALDSVNVVKLHHPLCGECGEMWPCREHRLDSEASHLLTALDRCCAHCGQPLGAAFYESFNDGLTTRRYHTAKKYRGPDGRQCHVVLAEAKRPIPGVAS